MKRKFRITRSIDFKRVRRLGKTYTHPLIVLVSLQNEHSRVGFITGKAVGNAVKRNRTKRQLRAIFDEFLPSFLKNADVLVIARVAIQSADYTDIRNAVKQLLTKAELIHPDDYDTGRPAS